MDEPFVTLSILWKIQCVGNIPKTGLILSGTKNAAMGIKTSILKAFTYAKPSILFRTMELIANTYTGTINAVRNEIDRLTGKLIV
jgi:hypothetical protein